MYFKIISLILKLLQIVNQLHFLKALRSPAIHLPSMKYEPILVSVFLRIIHCLLSGE